MNQNELMEKVEQHLDDAKTGILATVDEQGRPHVRWMTPRTLKGRVNAIYTVTPASSSKAFQLGRNAHAEWMIQSKSLNEIVNLKGKINIVENPSLKTEFLENLGNQLFVFWKVNADVDDFVVLETVLEEGAYYQPMKGKKETVKMG